MSLALVMSLAVVVFSVVMLAVVALALRRQFRALLRSLGALQTTVVPQLALLTREAAAAQALLARTFAAEDGAGPSDAPIDDGVGARSQGYTPAPRETTAGTRHA